MTFFKRTRKTVSLIVALIMMLSLMTTSWAASVPKDDLKGHWAESNMRTWVKEGLLSGYGEGLYAPNRQITRAEFITLTNHAFQLKEKTDVSFSDLKPSYWAYKEIAIAVKAGYVNGYQDHTIRGNDPVSREEAASMVVKLLKLNVAGDLVKELAIFQDAKAISSWSKQSVAAIAQAGIMQGISKGVFAPKGMLTRAEAVTLLEKGRTYKLPVKTYNVAGTYGPSSSSVTETIYGDVVVSVPDVTLQNIVIKGDLTLTEGVGEGDAFFKNVKVEGTTTIKGGGENSVHFEDSVLARISVDKSTGTIRIVVIGQTSIDYVVIHSPVKLEESALTDSGFRNVELADNLPSGSQVQLKGVFENVSVLSADIKISVPSGSIGELTVGVNATNTEVKVDAGATIMDMILNAVTKTLGQGTIERATINTDAKGSSFVKAPEKVDGDGNAAPAPAGNATPAPAGSATPTPVETATPPVEEPVIQPGCTGTVDECKEAKLTGLEISGFTLKQLDANDYTIGQDFNPDVYAYTIVTDRSMTDIMTATVTVTKSTYSSANYMTSNSASTDWTTNILGKEQNTFQIQINPQNDSRLTINVTSGDKIISKSYKVVIQYPRTIQEALKIRSFPSFNQNGSVTNQVYMLQKGSLSGEKIKNSDIITLSASPSVEPFYNSLNSSFIPKDYIDGGTGTWYAKIIRGGAVFAEGEYQYDFTLSEVLTGDTGLEVVTVTKQELIDFVIQHPSVPSQVQYGYTIMLDQEKLLSIVPRAKYLVTGSHKMDVPTNSYPLGLTKEDYKANIIPSGYSNSYDLSNLKAIRISNEAYQFSGSYYSLSPNDPKFIHDMFIFVGIYDENFKLIGQIILPVHFDQAHVADGYTAVGDWQPVE